MVRLKKLLYCEKERMEKIVKKTRKRLEKAPEGSLWMSKNRGGRQYYHYTSSKKYISKENMELIRGLAQKTYDEKVLKKAEKRLHQLEQILKDYDDDEIEQIYLKEHPDRKQHITPVEPTKEQLLEMWKKQDYHGLGFREDDSVILTEKGERVRSKSEKIIADYFYRNGIEYKYECPLCLEKYGVIYPDFTIFIKNSGRLIYFEHFGMMDEPSYARKAIRKIQTYEENGIFIGDGLIVTFETSQTVIGTKELDRLMKKYVTI